MVAAVYMGELGTIPIISMVALAWLMRMVYRVKDREIVYEIRRSTKKLATSSLKQAGKIDDLSASSKTQADKLDLITLRQLRHINSTSDIAGTVVRTSNHLKEMTTNKASLTALNAEPRTEQSIVPAASDGSAPKLRFTPPSPSNLPVSFPSVKVAMIADEFTADAFSNEWDIVQPTRENWREVIASHNPDFVFVESAWEAVEGSWRDQFVGSMAPRQEIRELIEYCNDQGIPTAFWNKEDPPHFEDFLETARLFDFVFTTEGKKVDEYKERLGHDRVAILPFAAQPRLHNPIQGPGVVRDRDITFGGMYFRDKYSERRSQMEMILPAAAKLGLDIFSRQDGSDERYRYPGKLTANVLGSLPYPEMLGAYHRYKVVINVNSVTDSATMCARRIFEASACGAAVVSTGTEALDNFFPDDTLSIVKDANDAYHQMRSLIRSPEYRDRKVHRAQRKIWENHTYRHRAISIMETMGIGEIDEQPELCSFFISTNRPNNLPIAMANFYRQKVKKKELVLLTHGFELTEEQKASLVNTDDVSEIRFIAAPSSQSLGANLNQLVDETRGAYLFRMDDDDHYGANYARDLLNALKYSGAALAGKSASYIYFEEMNATVLTMPNSEHKLTDFVRGATFSGPRETFVKYRFPEIERSEDSTVLRKILDAGEKIYASDRFNFAVNRLAKKSSHTWKIDDFTLFGTGEMAFVGFSPEQVDI